MVQFLIIFVVAVLLVHLLFPAVERMDETIGADGTDGTNVTSGTDTLPIVLTPPTLTGDPIQDTAAVVLNTPQAAIAKIKRDDAARAADAETRAANRATSAAKDAQKQADAATRSNSVAARLKAEQALATAGTAEEQARTAKRIAILTKKDAYTAAVADLKSYITIMKAQRAKLRDQIKAVRSTRTDGSADAILKLKTDIAVYKRVGADFTKKQALVDSTRNEYLVATGRPTNAPRKTAIPTATDVLANVPKSSEQKQVESPAPTQGSESLTGL